MKRITAIFLALAMTLLLAACGAASEAPKTPEPTAATDGPKLITNVDDLLAALAPNTEILLGEGTFVLSDAANYGDPNASDYYQWSDLGLGDYELVIENVEGLTIRGCGKGKTNLLTGTRFANVLHMQNCKDLTLADMTLGHTAQATACEGGVLMANRSSSITLDGLGLFGCGTLGLQAYDSTQITMQDCEVYECSIGGVYLCQSSDVTINSCAFHSLGKEQPVEYVFGIMGGENITVSNCMVSNNYVHQLIYGEPAGPATFRDSQFLSNDLSYAAFSFGNGNFVLANNAYEDNDLRHWYADGSFPALDLEGAEVIFEDPTSIMQDAAPGTPIPVSTGEQTVVHVKTADEFVKAVASDTCIILDAELIDFSKASGYQASQKEFEKTSDSIPTFSDPSNPNCCWIDNFDGPSLVITDVSNLTILAEGEDRTAHTLSAVPRYADVLTFENCSAVTLQGFTAGHTVEEGYCTGGVFLLRNCEDILIDNCGMYGCGTEGVSGEFSRNIQVVNSEIYECSVAGIELSSCENVAISGTIIRDIGDADWPGSFFRFWGNTNVTLDGAPLDGSYHGN